MPDTPLVNAITSFARCHLVEFAGSELANMVWAFATLAVHDSSLLESIAIRAALSLAEFEWQSLANTIWAYADALPRDAASLDAVAKEALTRIREAEPQGLANTAWACTILAFVHKPLLSAIAVTAALALEPRGSANILWAFAILRFKHSPFITKLATFAVPALREFQPQSLSNTAWALAEMRCLNGRPLLSFIGEEFLRRSPLHFLEGPHSYAVLWAAWVSGMEGLRLLDEVISWESSRSHQ